MDFQENVPSLQGSLDFRCPHCGKLSLHSRRQVTLQPFRGDDDELEKLADGVATTCIKCTKHIFWFNGRAIWPPGSAGIYPQKDLPDDVRELFLEAASIVENSPRAACAMLRLALESFCLQLTGVQHLASAIEQLGRTSLPPQVIVAMNSVRLVGNRSVHAGDWWVKDDSREIAQRLFELINFIAMYHIAMPAQVSQFAQQVNQL